MNNKTKNILSVMIIAIMLVITVTATYAFFAANVTGTDASTSVYFATANQGITITFEGGEAETLTNIYPRETAWLEKDITIRSTAISSDVTSIYTFNMVVEENGYHPEDIKYTFMPKTLTGVEAGATGTSTLTNLDNRIDIGHGLVKGTSAAEITYTLKVYFVNDPTRNQNTGTANTANFYVTYNWGTPVNLTVNLDGGTGLSSTQVAANSNLTLQTPTKEGFVFIGWTASGATVTGNKLTMGSVDATITASWEVTQTATTGAQKIAALCTDDTTCTANNLVKDADNNIRYIGSSPNNYIEFNGETWRIVGIFNVKKNASDTTGKQRIKIVKDEEITRMAFDAGKSQVWADSDIELYLNGRTPGNYYYTLSDAARGQIEKAVWNTGLSEVNSSGTTPADVYAAEKRTQTAESIVGLISVSDYGYAGGSSCTNLSDTSCGISNWLKPSSWWYWTITPNSLRSTVVWGVYSDGDAGSYSVDLKEGSVRPAIYLRSNVNLTGTGENTSANIYKIS